jgi:undecaprenyl-diphosphatase
MNALSTLDRSLGRAVRRAARAVPGGLGAAQMVASAMSPAFRLAVAAMIARPGTRGVGLRCLGAGVAAGVVARLLRDRLSRPRPGHRPEGGFPSRHAAAAVAIALAASRGEPRIGRALVLGAALGLTARVAAAEHDPADIVAGVALGVASARAVEIAAAARAARSNGALA